MIQKYVRSVNQRSKRALVSAINITPLVDVMLVLLIIFMITSPMLVSGIDVDLPKTNAKPLSDQDEPLVLSIDNKGDIYLVDTKIDRKNLASALSNITKEKKDTKIFIKGDQNVAYGQVVSIITEIHAAGFLKATLISNIKYYEK